jgi:argininosuccinate synthase
VKALDRRLEVIAPMRDGMGMTRDQEIVYAEERGIEIPVTHASPYSVDVNLWGRSVETGVLEDPWQTPPPDAYDWTVAPSDAPAPVEITISFDGGIPVAIDGKSLDPVDLVETLNGLAGSHGVGRIDHIEDRLVGIKSREVYEAPAAVLLHAAHRAIEGLALSKDQLRFGGVVATEVAQATYDGLWFTRLQRDLRGYVAAQQRVVSGDVRIRLDHGTAAVVGRRSPNSLYDRALATYDEGDAFDHASAVGFISIFGLPLRTEAAQGAAGLESVLDQLPVEVLDAEVQPVAVGS